jgi:NADP-reducing hydrogenase subunit HndB
MDKILSLDGLRLLKDELIEKRDQASYRGITYVTVGIATCSIAAGALDVLRALEDEIKACQLNNIVVTQTGCLGLCSHEPILEVVVGDSPKVAYGKVVPDLVKRIVREHILEGNTVKEFVVDITPFPTI